MPASHAAARPCLLLMLGWSALFAADAGSDPEALHDRLPVLVYHHLVTEAPQSGAELHVDCFAWQMGTLYDAGFSTLTLADLQRHHEAGGFPERSVLITFDDGYRSYLEHAHPILQAYGFGAVLFPVVALRPGLQRAVVWAEHLSFHEIRWMCADGGAIDVGSHTYDLHHVSDAGLAAALHQPGETGGEHLGRVFDDLHLSRVLLEAQVDREIEALAWPYGVVTPELVEVAVAVGFSLLFTTEEAYVTPESDLTALPRFHVANGARERFIEILEGALP